MGKVYKTCEYCYVNDIKINCFDVVQGIGLTQYKVDAVINYDLQDASHNSIGSFSEVVSLIALQTDKPTITEITTALSSKIATINSAIAATKLAQADYTPA